MLLAEKRELVLADRSVDAQRGRGLSKPPKPVLASSGGRPAQASLSLPDSLSWRSLSAAETQDTRVIFGRENPPCPAPHPALVWRRRLDARECLNESKMRLKMRLTECVHEASGPLLVVADAFSRPAGLGRLLVFRVAAAGAVVAAGGRGAVGVRRAAAAAELVHDARFRHQFCNRTRGGGERRSRNVCRSEN